MTAKEFLRSIRTDELELKMLGERIEQTRKEAEGIRAMQLSDMPKGGLSKDAADLISEVLDLQTIYFRKAQATVRKRKQASLIMSLMDSTEQQSVLNSRYLSCKSWDEIIEDMHFDRSWVYRLHGAALQAFAKIYDEKEQATKSDVKT